MKKALVVFIATGLLAAYSTAWAGSGCCPLAAKKAQEEKASNGLAALNLTAEQQTKMAALREKCGTAKSREECAKMCNDELKKILNAEQFTAWQKAGNTCVRGESCPTKTSGNGGGDTVKPAASGCGR